MLFKKLAVSFGLSLFMIFAPFIVNAEELIPGGESVGIVLQYQGVIISGGYDITVDEVTYNPLSDGFQKGDLIVAVNNVKVDSILTLSKQLRQFLSKHQSITLSIIRNNKEIEHEIAVEYDESTNKFSTGLYVKDTLSGVGTLTYYNPKTHSFATLGHAMNAVELSDQGLLQHGNIYSSQVTGVKKAKNLEAGQKIAQIEENEIGEISEHTNLGIYGIMDNNEIVSKETMETAEMDEIELGNAYFLTVINGNKIEKCNIEIKHLEKQSNIAEKGITFEITDEKIIKKTNGIIQGMSGSPIIQNNKIIGCVTHVSSKNPKLGYGLYIEWMLQMDNQ